MAAEYEALEANTHDLANEFKQRCRALQQSQSKYQALKAQVMASQVASAAGDEIKTFTARRDRFIDRMPGTRIGSTTNNRMATQEYNGTRTHARVDSRSSSTGAQQPAGLNLKPSYTSHIQGRMQSSRVGSSRKCSSLGTFTAC